SSTVGDLCLQNGTRPFRQIWRPLEAGEEGGERFTQVRLALASSEAIATWTRCPGRTPWRRNLADNSAWSPGTVRSHSETSEVLLDRTFTRSNRSRLDAHFHHARHA